MSLESKIESFDPNGMAVGETLFGLPFEPEEARLIIIPIPWEVTVSYRTGTGAAPSAILEASKQVDLFESEIPDAWKLGVAMLPIPEEIAEKSHHLRKKAEVILNALSEGEDENQYQDLYEEINKEGDILREYIRKTAMHWIGKGKRVALLGGDHSTPLGLMDAMGEAYGDFGILQIDAHCDLRDAYEGFKYSHASIMFNALQNPRVTKLVQVGIRDFCEQEFQLAQNSDNRVKIYEYRAIRKEQFSGKSWYEIADDLLDELPENIYISFDIDGLDPSLCPNTGTPVPGGFRFEEVMFLIEKIVEKKKKIIGFDLNEVGVGEDEWDANVGARVLWGLCNYTGKSLGLI